MKKGIIILMLLCLTGCSARKDVFMGKPHMAVHQENALKGRSMYSVRKFFGEPLSIRKEAPHQLWTYRQNDCVSLIYFDDDNRVSYAEVRGSCREMKQQISMNTQNATE